MSPGQIRDEVETLSDFNEAIPIGLPCEYIRSQLDQGKGKTIRQMAITSYRKHRVQRRTTETNGVKPILQCEVQCLENKWGNAWGRSKNSPGLQSRLR